MKLFIVLLFLCLQFMVRWKVEEHIRHLVTKKLLQVPIYSKFVCGGRGGEVIPVGVARERGGYYVEEYAAE